MKYNKMGISIPEDDELRFKALCKLQGEKVSSVIVSLMNTYFTKELRKLPKDKKSQLDELKASMKK